MTEDSRQKLIAEHLEMAAAIAADCATRFNLFALLPYDDVLGYAQQGLVEAASRYSPDTGTNFRTFSLHRNLLDRLESQINLPAWLVTRGFSVAPHQPDPTQLAMTSPTLEVFLLRKDVDCGGWSYFNTAEPNDRGRIADFMIKRDGATLETCVVRMGGCVTRSHLTPEGVAYQAVVRDRANILHVAESVHVAAIRAERNATRALDRVGVDRAVLDEWRFGRIRTEQDVTSLLRNPTGLEHSRYRHGDRAIVFIERPIDAIAYERLHGKQHACYVYTGEDPSLETKRKIAHVLADVPDGMKAVLAFGRDRRGNEAGKATPALPRGIGADDAAAQRRERRPPVKPADA